MGLLRGMAAKTLRHAGFDVDEAGSGEEGLSRFEAGTYDLVLLDVMLPGLDGFEVCQRIRELPNGAALPILMLTGLNDTSSIEQAYVQARPGPSSPNPSTGPCSPTACATRCGRA